MVLAPRIELGWPCDRGILSPLRLPIPPREPSKKRAEEWHLSIGM